MAAAKPATLDRAILDHTVGSDTLTEAKLATMAETAAMRYAATDAR
jgi:hypothetical protein